MDLSQSSCVLLLVSFYVRAPVLLKLLNKLRKRYKMQGLSSILLLFRNEFNNFNNTGARVLDSVYLMPLRLL